MEAAHKKTEVKEGSSRTTDNVALINYTARKIVDFTVQLFKRNWLIICEIQRHRYYWLKYLMSVQNTAYLAG